LSITQSSENDKATVESLKKKISVLEEAKRTWEAEKSKLKPKAVQDTATQELEGTIATLKEKIRALEKQLKNSVDTSTLLMNKIHAKDHQMKQLQNSHQSENDQFTKKISGITKAMKAKIEEDVKVNQMDIALSKDSLEKIETCKLLLKNWKTMI